MFIYSFVKTKLSIIDSLIVNLVNKLRKLIVYIQAIQIGEVDWHSNFFYWLCNIVLFVVNLDLVSDFLLHVLINWINPYVISHRVHEYFFSVFDLILHTLDTGKNGGKVALGARDPLLWLTSLGLDHLPCLLCFRLQLVLPLVSAAIQMWSHIICSWRIWANGFLTTSVVRHDEPLRKGWALFWSQETNLVLSVFINLISNIWCWCDDWVWCLKASSHIYVGDLVVFVMIMKNIIYNQFNKLNYNI